MDTELADRLDRSIGPAPESDDLLAGLLAAGHGAVRRRRVATVAGTAVAVLVVAAGVAVATGGSPDRATAPASEPTATASAAPEPPTPTPAATASVGPAWAWGHELAAFNPTTGELEIHPGATVVQRIDNPYHLDPPRGSVAVAVAKGQRTMWYAVAWDGTGASGATTPAQGSFRAWVQQVSAIASSAEEGDGSAPTPGFPGQDRDDLVAFVADHGERLGPVGDVVVLEQRAGVDVGPSFATAADDSAAAEVRTADGTVLFVLARRTAGGPAQYIAVTQAEGGADLDAFLALARDRYAEGSGLL